MRKRKPIEITCIDCGVKFMAYSSKALRCETCREKAKNECNRRYMKGYRNAYKLEHANAGTYIPPKMSIGEKIKAMEEYNKEHNTHLSYGQYVLLTEGGKSNGKRKRR